MPVEINDRIEHQRQRDPDDTPDQSFPAGNSMSLTVKDSQVQPQHCQHEHVESDPQPNWCIHNTTSPLSRFSNQCLKVSNPLSSLILIRHFVFGRGNKKRDPTTISW